MSKLMQALAVLIIQAVIIVAGIALDQAWLSGLTCVFAWTPAAMWLGYTLAGFNFSLSVKEKSAPAAAPKLTESPKEIQKRMSKVEQ